MRFSDPLLSAAILVLLAGTASAQTEVTREQAFAAMASIGLDGADGAAFTFTESRFDNGDIVFENVIVAGVGPEVNADSLSLDRDPKTPPPAGNGLVGGDLLIEEARFVAPRLDEAGDFDVEAVHLRGLVQTSTTANERFEVESLLIEGMSDALADMVVMAITRPSEDISEEMMEGQDIRLARFEMNGMRATGSDPQFTDMDFFIERIAIDYDDTTRLGSGVMQNLVLSGRTAESGPIDIGMQEIRLDGLNSELIGQWASALEAEDEQGFLESYFETSMLRPQDLFSDFAIEGISLIGSGMIISLDELSMMNLRAGELNRSRTILDGLRLSPDADNPQGLMVSAALAQIGYERLDLSGEFNNVYDVEAGRIWTEGENYYRLQDGFRIDFEADLAGYDRLAELMGASTQIDQDDPQATQAFGAELLGALVLHRLSLSLTDEGILDRVVANMSASQQMSEEDVRAQLGWTTGTMTMGATQVFGTGPALQLNSAIVEFFANGGRLDIELEPQSPTSLGEMMQSDPKTGGIDLSSAGFSASYSNESD